MGEKVVISVEEFAKIMGISKCSAYSIVHSDGFPTLRLGRRILIPVHGLHAWIDENTARRTI